MAAGAVSLRPGRSREGRVAARPGQDHSLQRRQRELAASALSTARLDAAGAYDPDDIDYFFIIDGDLDYYLIPVAVVGGLSTISLSAYEQFRLRSAARLQPT